MKHITLFILLLATAPQSRAQSVSDFFKSLFGSGRTETAAAETHADAETQKFPAASALTGTWVYRDLIVDYTGDDVLAKMAVSALRGQAADLAAKMGLQAGRDKVQWSDKGRMTLEVGGKSLDATYKYMPATGTMDITLRAGDRTATFRGTAELTDTEQLSLTFDAADCMRVIRTVAPEAMENTYFKTLNAIVEQYPGLRGGCKLTRGR